MAKSRPTAPFPENSREETDQEFHQRQMEAYDRAAWEGSELRVPTEKARIVEYEANDPKVIYRPKQNPSTE